MLFRLWCWNNVCCKNNDFCDWNDNWLQRCDDIYRYFRRLTTFFNHNNFFFYQQRQNLLLWLILFVTFYNQYFEFWQHIDINLIDNMFWIFRFVDNINILWYNLLINVNLINVVEHETINNEFERIDKQSR